MKKSWIAVLVIIILLAGAFMIMSFMGPDLRDYEKLKDPRITEAKDQKMIEARLTGTPTEISGKAIGALFGAYFKLKKDHPEMKMAAPRARWPKDLNTKKEEWVGVFGMPVPETVKESEITADTNAKVKVSVAVWKYGKVAEILHVGSYASEPPTIERLLKFIKDNGYTVTGDHEEEYVKGPGLFTFNQNGFYTVIRYRVVK
jgi:hypothetical protein